MRLRILDFNVWSGLTYRGILRMRSYHDDELLRAREISMLRQIEELDPDVICLHELNPVYARAKRIGHLLDMDFFAHMHLAGLRAGPLGIPWNLAEGDAVFARRSLGMRALGRLQLSGGYVGRYSAFNAADATQILGVVLRMKGLQIPVFTTHWRAGITPGPVVYEAAEKFITDESIPRQQIDAALIRMEKNSSLRLEEAEKSLRFMNTHGDGFTIFSGDLNAAPDSPEILRIQRAGFTDTLAAVHGGNAPPTWHYSENTLHQRFYDGQDPDLYLRLNYAPLKVPHRLDYVFYRSGDARLVDSRVVMKEQIDGVMASDHFGVLADFEI